MAYGVNAPFGLKPISSISGGSWTEKTNQYYISAPADGVATYGTSLFTGDPVIWNPVAANQGGGTIAQCSFNTDGTNAANLVSVLGVFMGCEYTLPTGVLVKSPYWPGATAVLAGSVITAYVIDDPDVVFDIQVSSLANTLNSARFIKSFVGQNFGLAVGGGGNNLLPNNPASGSTRTGLSAFYLNPVFTANNIHTTVTLPLKVIGYTNNPTNLGQPISYVADATTTPFLNVMVQLNNHTYRAGSLGVVAA
jgi:hypothetical protein